MKTLQGKGKVSGVTLIKLLVVLALLATVHQAAAQGARFFRITGPAATKITAFLNNGSLVWSNALTGTNFTIQTTTSLPGKTNWVDYVQLPVTNVINTNQIISFNAPIGMAFIPAGQFTMGDTFNDTEPVTGTVATNASPTNIYVSSFYMDVNLVSYAQWQSVYNYATNHGYGFDNPGAGRATNHPVQTVSWYDCVKWCNARSQQAGLTPVYYTNSDLTAVYTNAGNLSYYGAVVYVNWSANGYRLPTEAEWEKAARGGLSGKRFPWGDTISQSQANYWGYTNSRNVSYDFGPSGNNPAFTNGAVPYTSPIGYFAPNGYGLYDMAGNVREWCSDYYGTPYGQPTTTNPTGPAVETISIPNAYRIFRGGGSGGPSIYAECGYRQHYYPTYVDSGIGLRCVRSH
jgi:formylglycine-generating enzyme